MPTATASSCAGLSTRPSDYNDAPPDTWPGPSPVNIEPDPIARHPFCEKIGHWLWVTYALSYPDGGQTDWVIKRTSCDLNKPPISWEGTASVSAADGNVKDFPSLSTAKVVAWAESSTTTNHWVIKANVADSLVTLTNPDSNSKFVSI